jgi:TonB family protein
MRLGPLGEGLGLRQGVYTAEALHDRSKGTLVLAIVIDTQGNVTDVQETSESLGKGLNKSAMDTVKTAVHSRRTRRCFRDSARKGRGQLSSLSP